MKRRVLACALFLAGCGPVDAVPDAPSTQPDVSASDDSVVDAADRVDATDAQPAIDVVARDVAVANDDGPAPMCAVHAIEGACVDTAICTSGQVTQAGECPGPANIECCAPPNATWCPTNGLPLPNEGLVEEPGEGGCPDGMLRVTTYCVDRFEAALRVVNADGTSSDWSPYWHPPPGTRMRAYSLRGAVPQGYASGVDAAAACMEAGKRLCTDTEWLRACQGPMDFTFPYGATRMPGVCNDARSEHPAIQCFDSSASWVYDDIGYPGINQQADTVDRTGTRAGCITSEGAFDMMGNLHEWTADPAGTFRGGFYVDTVENGPGCLYATTAHDVTHWDYSTGFRCCADAP